MAKPERFKTGERVKYIGYPVETTGTIVEVTADSYVVRWDDGQRASFCFERPRNDGPGRVVRV